MSTTTETVTQGRLSTKDGDPLPLSKTAVRGRIDGPIAEVEVTQEFENPGDEAIEAVYAFPLPPDASVHRMELRIDERIVRAVVKEKEEARQAYERARAQGRSATLLEQEAASLFTLSVANVPPRANVEVTLAYQQLLAYDDDEWRFVFPMVAPERYREVRSEGAGGRRPPRVPTGERPADVVLEIELSSEGALDNLRCPTHRVDVEELAPHRRRVRLHDSESIPNRDFVLTFRAGAAGVRPAVRFERAEDERGTFLLTLTPPATGSLPTTKHKGGAGEMRAVTCGNCGGIVTDLSAVKELPGIGPALPCTFCGAILAPSTEGRFTRASRPRDVAILVDRSASMRGSLPQARRAVRALLDALAPGDAVQLLSFDHERGAFDGDGSRFVALSPEVVAGADDFLKGLSPRGGTELEKALERVAELPVREDRTRAVVLVTDGAVGNEGRLLRRAPEILGPERRLFVLGLGPSVDRRLAERLARACGGASDHLTPNEDVEPVLARFARRVREGGPVLTGLSVAWEGARPVQVYPSPIPDLFGAEPVRLLGRFDGVGASRLVLTGATADGRCFRQEIDVELPARSDETPGLERLWAKHRIEACMGHLEREPGDSATVRQEVVSLALRHALVSPYTSLVAEDSEVVGDGEPRRVDVPMPARGGMILDLDGELSDGFGAAEPTEAAAPVAAGSHPMGAPPPAPARPPMARYVAAPAAAPHDLLMSEAKRSRVGGAARAMVDAARGAFAGGRSRSEAGGTGSQAQQISPIPMETPGSEAYDADELRWLASRATGELDLVFLVDETGSMGPYIDQVKLRLLELVRAVKASPLCRSLRLGLVTYRDHPPQDQSYASKVTPLTGNLEMIERAVRDMTASGGGDGPESVTDGLFDVVRLDWRPGAAKAVAWFGDAPPHGVEHQGDGFPQGCPCGNHWYAQAESLREMGIAVYAVGCLPGLCSFAGAEDVFRTVASTTRGTYLPLTRAGMLVPLIAGAAATELDKQRIDAHLADVVAANVAALGGTDEAERVRWLTEALVHAGIRPRSMDYDPDVPAATPLRFRDLVATDVQASLDRLRLTGRAEL